jgi:hypothetical protein
MLLAQYQLSSQSVLNPGLVLFINMLVLFVGAIGILYRVRLSAILVLLLIALPQGAAQYYSNQTIDPDRAPPRFFDVADMLMAMAGLAFFIGYHRLHGIWFGVLPANSTHAANKPGPPNVRSEDSLRPSELMPLIFLVPGIALAAELACILLRQPVHALDLPPRWRQALIVAWAILLTVFLAAHAFRYWRRLQMDRVTALVMLHDILWHETRGEQRRIHRWLAWMKLHERI